MFVELINYSENPENLIAKSAKLCYSSKDISEIYNDDVDYDKDCKFVDMLSDLHHYSPFEHINFTFAVGGVSRALLAQLTRHRIASYSVKSQRYVNESQFEYYTPNDILNESSINIKYQDIMNTLNQQYQELHSLLKEKHITNGIDIKVAEKLANEDARYILPNACTTQLVMTMNIRSLINFFEHRCCNRAQSEVRELAYKMLILCRGVLPIVFNKVGPVCLNKPCPEGKMTCGCILDVRNRYSV